MAEVTRILETMGLEQCLLAFVFLGSYAGALGELAGGRGRRVCAITAFSAMVGFGALSDPWEHGVIVIAVALVGMGLFAGAVWALWTAVTWHDGRAERAKTRAIEPVPKAPAARPLFARLRASLRFI
jgi:hypothetical protein